MSCFQTACQEQLQSGIPRAAQTQFTIRHNISADATKTLIGAFVLSRTDYCNSLLAGIPKYLFDRLHFFF